MHIQIQEFSREYMTDLLHSKTYAWFVIVKNVIKTIVIKTDINFVNIDEFMSTLKMVLHTEKTLETIILKTLSKSQKFARKVFLPEIHYS